MSQIEDRDWRGHEVVDPDGSKIGTVEDFFVDRQTNQPEWALVNTGLFGMKQTLVPFAGSTSDEHGRLRVPYEKNVVKDAPNLDPDADVSEQQEAELYGYYGLDRSGAGPGVAPAADQPVAGLADDDRETTLVSGSGGVDVDDLVQRQAQIDEAERERQEHEQERQRQEEERLAHERERLERERELNERESELTAREREMAEREASASTAAAPSRDDAGDEREDEYVGSAGGQEGSSTGAVSRLRRFGGER